MNIKKLFATLAGVSLFAQTVVPSAGVFGANYSDELVDAYNWAHSKSITTKATIDDANMYAPITRAEMAKMLANWAKDDGRELDTSKACNFSDTASVGGDLGVAIVEACQLGLMGQGITAFRPYDTISRAEFGTALSRALWGNKYEGGNPYYANHLNALKSAGIMTQIANAESTKEVRGYVMLMLMRSEEGGVTVDCDDPDVILACLDEESDACPASCREDSDNGENEDNNNEEDEVVRSGDLAVSADSSKDAKVFIGRPSDLDILTFKTSEEVEISKVVLERYGYSTPANVASVWLENEEGTVITNKASVDSKGQVKLTLKKDYKKVDGELNATIVLETVKTNGTPVASSVATEPGSTFGFKVVDVTSTAEDVDLANYKPATYEAIAYDGSTVTLISRAYNAKTYNFEAGEMYEVAKFKIQTPDDSAIVVKGFTMKNNEAAGTRLDLRKYFDKAEVTIGGEAVKGLSAEANKNDELVVSFKDFEVAAKEKAEVIVKVSLSEDFDTFGKKVTLDLTDINAVDAKVESRVSTTYSPAVYANTTYQFEGGKVKLVNTKLGNVDAAQNSEDVVVAEGTITVPETIKGNFTITTTAGNAAGAIKQLTFVVNGDEYDADPVLVSYDAGAATVAPAAYNPKTSYTVGQYVTYDGAIYKCSTNTAGTALAPEAFAGAAKWTLMDTIYSFTFNNVEIEKSGKVKFLADVYDYASWNSQSVQFSNFGLAAFAGSLTYDESGNPVTEVSGTISFSKVTIQPAKASMSNSLTKDVEFMNKETNRLVVFDGTYTAKKGDIELNEFAIYNAYNLATNGNNVTFYVYVDGEEVGDAKVPATVDAAGEYAGNYVARDTFDKVLVKDGESVSVKVEAEVEAIAKETISKYDVDIRGEDINGNTPSGKGNAKTVQLKVVDKGSVKVSDSGVTKQTILRRANDAVIARFLVKPADGAESVNLEEIEFNITNAGWTVAPNTTNPRITVKVDSIEEDDVTVAGNTFTYEMNRNVPSEGVEVVVSIDDEADEGNVTLDTLKVNGKSQSKDFTKNFVEAAVEIVKQTENNGSTIFTLAVDKDSDVDVRNFTVYYNNKAGIATSKSIGATKTFDDGDTLSVNGEDGYKAEVTAVSYEYSSIAATASCAAPYELNGGKTACQGNATELTNAHHAAVGPTVANAGAVTPDTSCAAGKTYYSASASVALGHLDDGTKKYTAVASCAGDPKAQGYYELTSEGSDESCDAPYQLSAGACIANPTALTAAYTAAGDTVWNTINIAKAALSDYFKIGDDDISIFKL